MSRRPFLFASSLLLLPALTAQAQIEVRQAGQPDAAVYLVPRAGGARIELSAGQHVDIQLPERSDLLALAALEGGWLAAGTHLDLDGQRKLLLWTGERASAEPFAPPPGQRGAVRDQPVPLVAGGHLLGLAWLEGSDSRSLAVYAAAWTGSSWGVAERVAAPGPGSQLALTGAVLEDGSWALAWSRFDGMDDEIFWTARQGGRWAAPARVSADNQVPDVLPALAAVGSGAVLAWSRYDGNDYRLVLARIEGGAVRGERMVGEAGSLDATFVAGAGSTRLLYKSTAPNGWAVLELDRAGRITSRGLVETAERSRPVLVGEPGNLPRLRWPGREQEASMRLRQVP